jgi:MFS family permease
VTPPPPQPPPPTPAASSHDTAPSEEPTGIRAAVEAEVALEGAQADRHDPYAALRSANYRNFALGFIVSSTGLQMFGTAVLWEIYQRAGNDIAKGSLYLGYAGLVRALPVILFALPAGHLADIYDRRRILIFTQLAFAVAAAVFAFASHAQVHLGVFYLLLGLIGCARVFNGPTRSSLLPLIVPPESFHNAVTWNSGAFQFSAMVGPIAAGLVLAWSRAAWPVYLCTAAGCLIFAVTSTFIRPRVGQRAEGGDRFTARSMVAGLSHLWRERTILSAITLDLFAVLLGGATYLLPVYAADILHVGPGGYGWLRSAPYIGAFVMALVLAHRPAFRRAGPTLLWSVAGFGLCTIVFGLSRSFTLSLAALFLAGALDNISVVVRHVLVQVRTPDQLRGRVSAVNSVFIESSNELGGFESGLVASFFGPVISVVAGGIGTVVVVLGIAAVLPEIRRLGRLDPPADPKP